MGLGFMIKMTLSNSPHPYYNELFTKQHHQSHNLTTKVCPTTIKQEDYLLLSNLPTMEEITSIVFSFHPFFYKKYWHIVGPWVYTLCQKAFKEGAILDSISLTHVCLIPKCKIASSLKNFCPISLCNNISNKIITKTIFRRLRGLRDKLIAPCQFSFL